MIDNFSGSHRDACEAGIAEVLKHVPCCSEENNNQKFYQVWNTANNKILVIATSQECALYLARRSGHIKADANGLAAEAPGDLTSADNPFAGSLRRALKAGRAGCIKRVGDFATIPLSGLVFAPIASIE